MTALDRRHAPHDPLVAAYIELRPTLVRAFAARLRSRERAEELAQELFLRIQARPAGAVDDAQGWLFRAARNLMVDGWRAEGRALRLAAPADDPAETLAPSSSEPSAERALAGRQALARALQVVEAMPPRMREAFRLNRLDGLTQPETARRMGVSIKVVERHLASALERLTAELKGLWP